MNYNHMDTHFHMSATKCENMLNSITFFCKRDWNLNDWAKNRLCRVSASTLIQLGYNIKKYGYNEDDILYLDEESYKNLMYSQAYYESKINNVINDNEDINNVYKHR